MTTDKKTGSQKPRHGMFARLTGFERSALGGLGGLVSAGVVAAVLFPPLGGTSAPRAAYDLDTALRLEPVPTVAVAAVPLAAPVVENGLSVEQAAEALAYDLVSIADGEAEVPRVFLASMPHDLADVPEVDHKKSVFFKSVLPLVLQVNEELRSDRERLLRIVALDEAGDLVPAADRLWAAAMSNRYKTERGDYAALVSRIDIIPPSLALAQAAKESGWGTSRFARLGNALFGQWTWSEDHGIAPKDRPEGSDHLVREFDTLLDSVEAYMLNLNRHAAYRELRSLRAGMRARGEEIDGSKLAMGLERYSELGMEYVERIQSMISFNELLAFDDAQLSDGPITTPSS